MRETTNAAFSSWTSPLQRQDPDTQEEKKQEMLSRIMGKLKSGKKLSAKELDFLRRTDPILYAHALRVQRMAEALKQQLSHAKSKQEANDMITSAIAGVSDKDPDKEYLLAAYNEVSKNFHKSPAYQRLPNTPGKKELVAVGVQAGMKKTYCERVAEEIRLCVNEKLEHYLK